MDMWFDVLECPFKQSLAAEDVPNVYAYGYRDLQEIGIHDFFSISKRFLIYVVTSHMEVLSFHPHDKHSQPPPSH